MILFLTSSPTGNLDGSFPVEGFDNRNGFLDRLRAVWPREARCRIISAFPEDAAANRHMTDFFADAARKSGLPFSAFDCWEDTTEDTSAEALRSCQVIFLGGGHVPTQNAFFRRLNLREHLEGFNGIVVGISAGTMNAADEVYAQPELEGEAADPAYRRFIPGLGLTPLNILPHYQMVKDNVLDGLRLFEDITFADSMGREFLALEDGSYVLQTNGSASVFGNAWRIADGKMEKICGAGGELRLF